MTTANQPENQKPHGSLSDLGQISTDHAKPTRPAAIWAGTYAPTRSLDDRITLMAHALDAITSPNKYDREWAKKQIREWAKLGGYSK